LYEARNPKHVLSATDCQDDDGRVRPLARCEWTDDGQLLAVSNSAGDVSIYLTSVPMLGAFNLSQVAAMSTLTECVLHNFSGGQLLPLHTFQFQMEPTMISMGPLHLAAVIHNVAYLFNCREEYAAINDTPICSKEFNSNIHDFVLNHVYCAARCGDKAFLHRVSTI
jgi:hypothetical protein